MLVNKVLILSILKKCFPTGYQHRKYRVALVTTQPFKVFTCKTNSLRSICQLGTNTDNLTGSSHYYLGINGLYLEDQFLKKCLSLG